MPEKSPQEAVRDAANRLHHLSMRYVGAFAELASGQKCGLLARDHPGLKETRDLIDLLLFCRAEINALSMILVKQGVMKLDDWHREMAENYAWFTSEKAKFLGCEVTDFGLKFTAGEGK